MDVGVNIKRKEGDNFFKLTYGTTALKKMEDI